MTIDRALHIAEQLCQDFHISMRNEERMEYHRLCRDMIRAQQEAEKNDPLTLDELEICRKSYVPIWAVAKLGPITCSGWALAGMRNALTQDFTSTVIWYETYGMEWIAYRRPPENEEKEMSVRRNTTNRLTLFRTCHTCGKTFTTTASSPWMRSIPNADGDGKQKICYFCSSACYKASYKHVGWYDGKAEERRAEREAKRDKREKNRRYYTAHAEQERVRARARYWADPEAARAANAYQRMKRKLKGHAEM